MRSAPQMLGVDPDAMFAATFALASGFAGLAGFVMTMFYGAVGYGAATTLGLKALVAAILGGIGSIPGAFLGGLLIGAFEALWSTAFPDRLSRRRGVRAAGDPADAAPRRHSGLGRFRQISESESATTFKAESSPTPRCGNPRGSVDARLPV